MLQNFIATVKNHIESQRFSRADLDELITLSEVSKGAIPERAVTLMIACDETFDADPASRLEYLERISRICAVAHRHAAPTARRDVDTMPIAPVFTLGSEQRERAVQLCQEARERVFGVEYFDVPHRRRLLDRIAAIESEISQSFGLYDILRGGMNDLDEALTAFRQQHFPLRGIMAEIMALARNGSNDYRQLPMPDARTPEQRAAIQHVIPFS